MQRAHIDLCHFRSSRPETEVQSVALKKTVFRTEGKLFMTRVGWDYIIVTIIIIALRQPVSAALKGPMEESGEQSRRLNHTV